jgi:hypothetical protein
MGRPPLLLRRQLRLRHQPRRPLRLRRQLPHPGHRNRLPNPKGALTGALRLLSRREPYWFAQSVGACSGTEAKRFASGRTGERGYEASWRDIRQSCWRNLRECLCLAESKQSQYPAARPNLVVPVYNNAATLAPLCDQLKAALDAPPDALGIRRPLGTRFGRVRRSGDLARAGWHRT